MNKNELSAVIARNGENQGTLAKALGITEQCFSRKINGRNNSVFTQPEILTIKLRYNLSDAEIGNIFFNS